MISSLYFLDTRGGICWVFIAIPTIVHTLFPLYSGDAYNELVSMSRLLLCRQSFLVFLTFWEALLK